MRIGLIADTHGLMRPEALTALAGVDLIVHAGDVGGSGVLRALGAVAPVRAVFGNVDDRSDPALSRQVQLSHEGRTLHASHGHELGAPTPEGLLDRYAGDVVVYGHTHRALVHDADGRMVVNPGAAGPRRFSIPPSVALLTWVNGRAMVEIVWL
jgi:uncharacterized protein